RIIERTIRFRLITEIASERLVWMVSRNTLRLPAKKHISESSMPQSEVIISVWPGNGEPASFNDSLLIGAVAIASSLPARQKLTQVSIATMAARPAPAERVPHEMLSLGSPVS